MKHYIQVLISSLGAGILISIGGIVYLASRFPFSEILAALCFGIGLFTIIVFSLHLFTGKVGYIFDNKPSYLLDLLICWIGNLIGAVATGYIISLTRLNDVIESGTELANVKLGDSWYSLLILAFFCGIMIFIAVEMGKRDIAPVFKLVGIFLSVAVFILCSFEHCVADMFYFSLANSWSGKAILYIVIISIGNGLGSLFMYWLLRLLKVKNKTV